MEKRNGTFRARLVALGYSQVAGVDFSNHYSPVLCDTSFRLILVIIQKLKLPAWSLDIETAFLNGDLTEEIFKKVPDGFNQIHGEGKVSGKILRLNKSIYGLVQSARIYEGPTKYWICGWILGPVFDDEEKQERHCLYCHLG